MGNQGSVQGWLARGALTMKARVGNQVTSRGGVPRRLPPSLRSPRLSPKHRDEGRKTGSQRSSGSRSPSPSGGSGWGSPQQNGGSRQRSGAHGGRPGSAHSPPDVRTLGFAEGSPHRLSRLRRAGWGRVAEGAGPDGSPGDPTDAFPVPIPPTCAPQGVSGGLLGWMSVGCCSHLGRWSGEELGMRGHLRAWAAFGLAE